MMGVIGDGSVDFQAQPRGRRGHPAPETLRGPASADGIEKCLDLETQRLARLRSGAY